MEIKFRGKSGNKWIFGDVVKIDDRLAIINVSISWIKDSHLQIPTTNWDYIHEDSLGQYTNFHDKENNEIYIGDVVETPYIDPIFGDIVENSTVNAVIGFNDGAFIVDYGNRKIYLSELRSKIKVIGNIFDNKDLLD